MKAIERMSEARTGCGDWREVHKLMTSVLAPSGPAPGISWCLATSHAEQLNNSTQMH